MSRELKFRLIKDNKIVGYEKHEVTGNVGFRVYHSIINEDCEGWEWSSINHDQSKWISHDEKEQYADKKDKNGKEIYEGDKLKQCNGSINWNPWMDDNYTVIWTPKGYNLPYFMWDKEGYECMDSTHWCEIIGNIHEK